MSIRKPMVLVLAGPNGSGKSTITQYFDKIGEYTNADDVVAATGMNNFDAARFVDEKRYQAIDEKRAQWGSAPTNHVSLNLSKSVHALELRIQMAFWDRFQFYF